MRFQIVTFNFALRVPNCGFRLELIGSMDNGSFTIQYGNIVLEQYDPELDWNCRTISTLFVLIAFGLLLEFVGNGFLYGIFIYEKYGIDSMRRTIINMLLSQICFAYIFLNIFAMPFWIYGNFVKTFTLKLRQKLDSN